MKDGLASEAVRAGDDPRLKSILEEACQLTGMGFAAVARVTEDRWIACQVLDRIDFGLDPGDELAIMTTICNEIRECGQMIIIDHVGENDHWRTHHTPMLYGFESYASLPIILDDESFFGTLCAIDPQPRSISSEQVISQLDILAKRAAAILSERLA